MKYDAKIRSADKNKKEVNRIIQKYADESAKKFGAHNAVILDTSSFLTTNALIKAGYSKSKIEIPNFSSDYHKIKKKHRSTFNMSLSEYLDMINELPVKDYREKYSLIFMDYCCSVLGNKDVNPESDIEKMFKMRMPRNGSIFATTFSFRNGKLTNYEAVSMADYIVSKNAFENGYAVIKQKKSKAYNGMFFSVYELKKIIWNE